jgi:fatty acid synthase
MTWEEALNQCPPGVFPACHNGEANVTISGPAEDVTKFVAELQAKKVFARLVATGGVAYHSPYLAPILPTFEAHTRALVVEGRQRSSKWISTSRPESEWPVPMGNAEYVVNNMKSPVLFYGALKNIPENAVVLEVSAHALFVSVLKKSIHPSCNVLGLIRKGAGNNAGQFLSAVGRLHGFGFDVNLTTIYPKVQFPVSSGTPMIAPLVKWDHSETYSLPDYLFVSCFFALNSGFQNIIFSEDYHVPKSIEFEWSW